MRAYVAVTDKEWYEQLRRAGELDEVNFWQPSAGVGFKALSPGELFLFKLHSPDNFIVGGGIFSHWTPLRVSFAWDAFGEKNGAGNLAQMRFRIERYRRIKPTPREDYEIGCILVQHPFFFTSDDWLSVPDWQRNIVRGKTYDFTREPGATLWTEVQQRLQRSPLHAARAVGELSLTPRYGEPVLVLPRLGQGSFKVLVADTYQRRCAVTGERALPVLQAAHIRPYADGGDHRIDNGLLLRSDLHILFDRGYVTVTPQYRLEVSCRLRTDFDNGEEYLVRHGQKIWVPGKPELRPSSQFLSWHNEYRFAG
ncbi:MAG: HNH endonuclease [Gammaproteobacteria bacterium]